MVKKFIYVAAFKKKDTNYGTHLTLCLSAKNVQFVSVVKPQS